MEETAVMEVRLERVVIRNLVSGALSCLGETVNIGLSTGQQIVIG